MNIVDMMPKKAGEAPLANRLPRNVVVLGIVSFLNDISSEMTFTLLPLFLANVLGVGATFIGLIEGVADATASLLKVGSGWLSDRIPSRIGLIGGGYTMSALIRPFAPLITAGWHALGLRFLDRVGKGVRNAPRDALLADSTPERLRGRAFGFHRALDTAGAFVGLGSVALITWLSQQTQVEMTLATYRNIVWVAIIPGFLAALLVLLFVREVRGNASREGATLTVKNISLSLDQPFTRFLIVIILFTLGNASDAFLALRAQTLGLSVFQISLMLVLFNAVYVAVAYYSGIISDHLGRRRVVRFGWLIYSLIYLGFAMASAGWHIWLLYAVYGIYYGATEGMARAFVADLVPPGQRGTAYGLYAAAIGLTALPASVLFGALWQAFNPALAFITGAGIAFLAMILLTLWVRPPSEINAQSVKI